MLLVNETKEKIREKFNILNQKQNINKLLSSNVNSVYAGGKKKYDSAEIIDDVYSNEKYDYEDELNLPVDSDISKTSSTSNPPSVNLSIKSSNLIVSKSTNSLIHRNDISIFQYL